MEEAIVAVELRESSRDISFAPRKWMDGRKHLCNGRIIVVVELRECQSKSPGVGKARGRQTFSSAARTCVAIGASGSTAAVVAAAATGASAAGTTGATVSWGSDILLKLGSRQWTEPGLGEA
jgi:hypothetical protein